MTANNLAVANAFTRKTSRMRRNTRNSKWVTSNGSIEKLRAAPGRRVEFTHQPSVARSCAASLDESLPSGPMNSDTRNKKETNASVYSVIYDASEIPDPNIYSTSALSSTFDRVGLYRDECEVWTRTRAPLGSPKMHERTVRRSMSCPNTPFVLPETARVSPLPVDLPYGMDSPVSEIVDLGWEQFRDKIEDEREPQAWKDSRDTVFPRSSYAIPVSPRKIGKGNGKETQNMIPASIGPLSPYTPPSQTSQLNSTPTNAAGTKKKTSITDIYRSAKKIYTLGPQGEGQKAWRDIQTLREQKRLLKRKEKEEQEQEQWRIENEKKKQGLEMLLGKVRAAAAAYEPGPRGLSPVQPSKSPPPMRPPPMEPLRVSRRVTPPHGMAGSRAFSKGEKKENGGRNYKARKGSDASSDSCLSVPVAASASVHYDAMEVVVDLSKPEPSIPILDPAPRFRGRVDVGTASKKRGLPPPPVGISSVRAETVREGSKTTAPALAPGKKKLGLPPPPVLPSHSPMNPVGPVLYSPDTEAKLRWFAGLDDRQASRSHKKKKDRKKFLDVEVPADPSSHKTHADRTATRQQEQLKASISHPYATSCPGGSTANFAEESGGVGGPNAAISLPPGVVRKSQLQKYYDSRAGKGREVKRHTPLPPAPTLPPAASHTPEPSSTGADAKAKKEHMRGWLDWLPTYEGSGKSFYSGFRKSDQSLGRERKRPDSDLSFTCQGIDAIEKRDFAYSNAHETAPYLADPNEQQRPRVSHATRYQDPGPSRQTGPKIYVSDEDAALVPEPLFTGGLKSGAARGDAREVSRLNVRDTTFYALYDDVLSEYG